MNKPTRPDVDKIKKHMETFQFVMHPDIKALLDWCEWLEGQFNDNSKFKEVSDSISFYGNSDD